MPRPHLSLHSLLCPLILLYAGIALGQSNPAPFITMPLVPSSVPPGTPAFSLTVNGANFTPADIVFWNGVPLTTTFVNSHQIVAAVSASEVATAGTASISVSNYPASNTVAFQVAKYYKGIAFTLASTVAVGSGPSSILAGDFNIDGKLDLATANLSDQDPVCYPEGGWGTISTLLGDGEANFSQFQTLCLLNLPSPSDPIPLLIAGDFNGDGRLDLVAFDEVAGRTEYFTFLGGPLGVFASSIRGSVGIENGFPAVSGDFNRDGSLDLATHYDNLSYNGIDVYAGDGEGDFNYLSTVNGAGPINAFVLAAGDFNGDGVLDLAAIDRSSQSLAIFLGNGDGTFVALPEEGISTLVSASSIVAGDFDLDGKLDLAVADSGSTSLTILKGNGDGTFLQVAAQQALIQPSIAVATADLNGDGKLDLVVLGSNVVSVLLGNGDGTFLPSFVSAVNSPGGVAIGDFNGDGRPDLAVTNSSDNTVSILLQTLARSPVTVTVAPGQNPTFVNQPVTYTAMVWSPSGAPTGSISFKQGARVLGTVSLTDGQAVFTVAFAKAGNFQIVASYSGDEHFPKKNSQAFKQGVDLYPTDTGISASPNPSTVGQAVTLYARVFSLAPSEPTGTVTFKNGNVLLGKSPLVGGQATLTTKKLPVGTLTLAAFYSGDTQSAKSSGITAQVVNPIP